MMTGIIIVDTRGSTAHTIAGVCGFYATATIGISGMSGIMTVIIVCPKPVYQDTRISKSLPT